MEELLRVLALLDDPLASEVWTQAERREMQEKIKAALRKKADETLFERYQQPAQRRKR